MTKAECRYLLKLIAENTEGYGYANEDELLEDGQPIGKLQAKLSMMRDAAKDEQQDH